jgi:hypothetical protein
MADDRDVNRDETYALREHRCRIEKDEQHQQRRRRRGNCRKLRGGQGKRARNAGRARGNAPMLRRSGWLRDGFSWKPLLGGVDRCEARVVNVAGSVRTEPAPPLTTRVNFSTL